MRSNNIDPKNTPEKSTAGLRREGEQLIAELEAARERDRQQALLEQQRLQALRDEEQRKKDQRNATMAVNAKARVDKIKAFAHTDGVLDKIHKQAASKFLFIYSFNFKFT